MHFIFKQLAKIAVYWESVRGETKAETRARSLATKAAQIEETLHESINGFNEVEQEMEALAKLMETDHTRETREKFRAKKAEHEHLLKQGKSRAELLDTFGTTANNERAKAEAERALQVAVWSK